MERYPYEFVSGLTDSEARIFNHEVLRLSKSQGIATVLALTFGGLGAHHFYLGRHGRAIAYFLLSWTFIPSIVALFDALLMRRTVGRINSRIAQDVRNQIVAMRGGYENFNKGA